VPAKNDDVEIVKLNEETSVVGSLLDSLRAESSAEAEWDSAEPWIPETAGEGIEGTLVHIGSYLSEGFGSDRVLTTWYVDDGSTVWSVIPFHRELRKLILMNRQAEIGDKVALLYTGEKPSPTDPLVTSKGYKVARQAAARHARMKARGDASRVMTADAFSTKLS
jgi:hypothetical protein